MSVTAIVSARMGSSRLPGKVLLEVLGKPLLGHQVERIRRAASIERVVVATSTNPRDDAVADYCKTAGIDCFRGSEPDVLDRIYQAALAHGADPVVRLTGDDPLVDPGLLDRVVGAFLESGCEYAANVNPPTFPDGLDVEVIGLEALERIWREAGAPEDREHVTLYLRRSPGRFRTVNIANEEDLSHLHWAVDTPEHFAFVRTVFERLSPARPDFTWLDVLGAQIRGEVP